MPNFNIVKSNKPLETYRVASVIGSFDLKPENYTEIFHGDINIDDNWQIGLIVGNSGTGKTTIAKELFSLDYVTQFEYGTNAIIDDMPKNKSVNEITQAFNAVGFSSPPSWIKPYHVLSNGQKMRVDLANAILSDNETIVFDEFTSVVDRTVAQIGSYAIQKSIRKSNKKFIAVTCHFDVEDWLLPDWVFNTNDMTFTDLRDLKKKDQILQLKSTKQKIKEYGECLANIII